MSPWRRPFLTPHRLLLGLILAGLGICWALANHPAQAAGCDTTVYLDQYRDADRQYHQKKFEALRPHLQTLADLGFAPAQSLLGQSFFKGDGGGSDMAQAYRWIGLAAQANFPDAQKQIPVVSKAISATEEFRGKSWLGMWRANLDDCLSDWPKGSNVKISSEHKGKDPLVWLGQLADAVRDGQPEGMIYLASLSGIGFVANGPDAGAKTLKTDPQLQINEKLLAQDPTSIATTITAAARKAIYDSLQ